MSNPDYYTEKKNPYLMFTLLQWKHDTIIIIVLRGTELQCILLYKKYILFNEIILYKKYISFDEIIVAIADTFAHML